MVPRTGPFCARPDIRPLASSDQGAGLRAADSDHRHGLTGFVETLEWRRAQEDRLAGCGAGCRRDAGDAVPLLRGVRTGQSGQPPDTAGHADLRGAAGRDAGNRLSAQASQRDGPDGHAEAIGREGHPLLCALRPHHHRRIPDRQDGLVRCASSGDLHRERTVRDDPEALRDPVPCHNPHPAPVPAIRRRGARGGGVGRVDHKGRAGRRGRARHLFPRFPVRPCRGRFRPEHLSQLRLRRLRILDRRGDERKQECCPAWSLPWHCWTSG